MNIEQVHIPQRLEGEDIYDYKARRRMSQRLQERTTLLIASSGKGAKQARASAAKQARRKLVGAIGARQAKIAMRAARRQITQPAQ